MTSSVSFKLVSTELVPKSSCCPGFALKWTLLDIVYEYYFFNVTWSSVDDVISIIQLISNLIDISYLSCCHSLKNIFPSWKNVVTLQISLSFICVLYLFHFSILVTIALAKGSKVFYQCDLTVRSSWLFFKFVSTEIVPLSLPAVQV